jgi:hypothetical protein
MTRRFGFCAATRARVAALRHEANGDDAETLARLFEDAARRDDEGAGDADDGSAASRLRTILDATERRLIKGLHTALPFGDHGFRGDRARGGAGLRDPWASSRNQVGHFLTAVRLAFRPEILAEPVFGLPMRTWLGADPALSDEQVGKRLTIGHELSPDPGVVRGAVAGALAGAVVPLVLGLRGRSAALAVPVGSALGGLAGALAEQFLGFRRQYQRATDADERAFDQALAAAGRGQGPALDQDAAEAALRPLFDKIDVNSRGNSYQIFASASWAGGWTTRSAGARSRAGIRSAPGSAPTSKPDRVRSRLSDQRFP